MTIVDHIVRAANGMPQGGGYVWNNDRTDGGGCLKDLVHPDGSVILKAGRGTYCCGLTLEMLWRGWESYSKTSGEPFMRGLSADRAKQLQRAWFCIGTRKGAQDALVFAFCVSDALGRSFGIEAANRGIQTHGLYRFVRHPIYAAYLPLIGGYLLAYPSVWNALLVGCWLVCQVARIQREEAVLGQDEQYQAYAERVRWRLIPGAW